MRYPFGVTVTLVDRQTVRDQYGNTTVTETRTAVPDCAVAPRTAGTGDDNEQGRTAVIIGLTAYLPYGVDVDSADLIEIDGRAYEVDGMPGVWANPFTGSQPGIEVALRRAEG